MSIEYVSFNKRDNLIPLVKDWNETMIWSCLQGYMGKAYADSTDAPKSACFFVADFCFFAGEPNEELVGNHEIIKNRSVIMTAKNDKWNQIIEKVYPNSEKMTRYAIKKEPNVFNKEKLKHVVNSLDCSYKLKLIDEELYEKVMREDWSRDLCGQFVDAKDFCKRGLGVVVMHNGEIVSGASSYTIYDEGIEIEIDTRKDYRRKGLAYAAGAKLILECLERGLYPSWDAHNIWSVALAEKLGYNFDFEYTAYEVEI